MPSVILVLSTIVLPFLSLVAYLAFHASTLTSSQVPAIAPPVSLASIAEHINYPSAQEHLSRAIQIPTLAGPHHEQNFKAFHTLLAKTFPLVRQKLDWEVVNELSLLLKWQGSVDADGRLPILLLAHQDVVGVEDVSQWDYPPFGGNITTGYIYGRGALDMKGMLMAQLEATEGLLAAGYRPKRTVYLAFGHDEETSGEQGAVRIAKILQAKGLEFEFILDEGLPIGCGMIPGIQVPIAFIGMAEKGFADIVIRAKSKGGHGSMPFGPNAIHMLSEAIVQLTNTKPHVNIRDGPAGQLLGSLAPHHPSLIARIIMGNLWLFERLIALLPPDLMPGFSALTRTTWVVTKIGGGIAGNVLPTDAIATVNVRILPGETVSSVLAFIAKTIGAEVVDTDECETSQCAKRTGLTISLKRDIRLADPSAMSSAQSAAYRMLEGTIRHVFSKRHDGEDLIVAPSLLMGATDSQAYKSMSPNIFRFQPVLMGPKDPERIHGVNERISLLDYDNMINFFVTFIMNADNMGVGDSQKGA